MSRLDSKQRWGLATGGILLTLLLAAVFTFGSLNVPFEPKSWRAVMVLYAVSSFITAAFLVFGLILARTILRLWVERRREQLGARFKTKMVVGAMAISLLPIIFMFIVSYSLINRSLLLWFPRPLEIASDETQKLLSDLGRAQLPRLRALALAAQAEANGPSADFLQRVFAKGADAVWILDGGGKVIRGGIVCDDRPEDRTGAICVQPDVPGQYLRSLQSGVEVWAAGGRRYFAARVPASQEGKAEGFAVAGFRTSPDVLERLTAIQSQTREYYQEKQDLRALKRQMLEILLLFTVLLLSAVMWVALFLAKQVTIPIQALAEGTREVSSGNFDYQVPEQAQDELGILVRSFNTMTTQLRDSRSQIDQFTRNLQQAVQELERRRQLIETVLENIPTGVISLDAAGAILRVNTSVSRMFGVGSSDTHSLEGLLGADAARIVHYLMRRSLRMGVVSREIETVASGRVLHLAVTVSSLGPRRANTGYVLVLDDLTEVLRAQKSAAWQEVARRIAHEIKNPLTPIQLSAQRLLRFLERHDISQLVFAIRALPYSQACAHQCQHHRPSGCGSILRTARWHHAQDGACRESAGGARRRRPASQRRRESYRQCRGSPGELGVPGNRGFDASPFRCGNRGDLRLGQRHRHFARRQGQTLSAAFLDQGPRNRTRPGYCRSHRGRTRRQYPRRGQSSGRVALPR